MADNPDELTFSEGDVIIVDGEEDQEWWVSRGPGPGLCLGGVELNPCPRDLRGLLPGQGFCLCILGTAGRSVPSDVSARDTHFCVGLTYPPGEGVLSH